jgi:signal recognition particle GTPase
VNDQSIGHVEFIGPWEYFKGANGDLFRAPSNSPLDVWGYRMGARFESTPHATDLVLKVARQAFAS